ncbi:unnamed protein product [Soboliphyme baturini]|uniref:Reverse transcriptase domain-containing protein n=1 Tax=Soboliphyme baturini TaxID=241478 RepID=A0A183ICV0_9BILA|nr:unnamed protein product [Soboliphyme baturini]
MFVLREAQSYQPIISMVLAPSVRNDGLPCGNRKATLINNVPRRLELIPPKKTRVDVETGINGVKSRQFNVGTGFFRQGCILSPRVFVLHKDRRVRLSHVEECISVGDVETRPLRFVDDSVLLPSPEMYPEGSLEKLAAECDLAGTSMNPSKTTGKA